MGRSKGYLAVLALLLLASCVADPIRLSPGECAIITERGYYIVAGQGCEVQRLYR